MRCVAALLVLMFALPVSAGTAPEEVAAMLLSRDIRLRQQALELARHGTPEDVLKVLSRRGYDRGVWIVSLEKRLKKTAGKEHQRVRRMLSHLSAAQDAHVGIDFYVFEVPTVVAVRILGRGAPTIIHDPKRVAWEQWWQWLRKDKRVVRRFGRAIAGRDGRPGMVEIVRQVSYVQEFDFDAKAEMLDPVIGVVNAGATLRWTPRLSDDHERVSLDMHVRIMDLAKPIVQVNVMRGGRKVTIQKPEITKVHQHKTIGLNVGGHCAWRIPNAKLEKQDRVLLVLLRANLGPPKAER